MKIIVDNQVMINQPSDKVVVVELIAKPSPAIVVAVIENMYSVAGLKSVTVYRSEFLSIESFL